jgi:hypothetical protein
MRELEASVRILEDHCRERESDQAQRLLPAVEAALVQGFGALAARRTNLVS